MAAFDLLLAVRKFRQDKTMLNGMLIDLRRGKSIQTRIIAAEFFAYVLRLEKEEEYNKDIAKIVFNGRLVRKLVRCLMDDDEEDINLKRYAAEALSNLLVWGDADEKHRVIELNGRTALIENIQIYTDRQLRASAVIGAFHSVRSCEQCCQALRETDLLDRLPAILLDELNPENADDGDVKRRLKLISDLIEVLIDGSPPSALRVFSHDRLRKEIIARINYDTDEMRQTLRGVLVKSVLWSHKIRLLQEAGLNEALVKLESIDTSEKSAEVERAISFVRDACKN